jgi:hypothetical protein
LCLATVIGAAAYVATVRATDASGFRGTTIAKAQFGDIAVKNRSRAFDWESELQTEGLSDVYVQSNVWDPGGTTGWHTHPGHSLIIVTSGTLTAYEGDDPSCTPHIYTQGMGFVDPGGNHAHVIRNETGVEARTTTVQLIPAGATRRIDAPANGACPF